MQIIDGKKVSAEVKERVRQQTLQLKNDYNITPGLAVVIVGDDPASRVYVNNKKKACEVVLPHRRFLFLAQALFPRNWSSEILNLIWIFRLVRTSTLSMIRAMIMWRVSMLALS